MTENTPASRILILGAGAVGLALGSGLHAAGRRIHFVTGGRVPAHTITTHGIQRVGILGEMRVPPEAVEVSPRLADLPDFDFDSVLVCTKTTANPEVARDLATAWGKFPRPPRLVVCQNGWGNAETYAEALDPQYVASASILTGFRRNRMHEVEVTVHARAIQIGRLFSRKVADLEPLCAALCAGGIPCETSTTIEADLGAKLLYNCLLNPLGALANVPYGRLGESPPTRALMEAVAREIFNVLDAGGLQTHWASAESYLEVFYRDLLPPTAGHESSMLQDLRAGRPTEIDALSGAVTRLGRELGVATPINAALVALIHAAEQARQGTGTGGSARGFSDP